MEKCFILQSYQLLNSTENQWHMNEIKVRSNDGKTRQGQTDVLGRQLVPVTICLTDTTAMWTGLE